MKSLISLILAYASRRESRRNLLILLRFGLVLLALITVYSVIFHMLMLREGQHYSWVTGFYWTLTVMSTLGFGDITFHGDLGRIFSMLVLLTGMVFMLTLLPFTFIQFFYAPWMEAQSASRVRRALPRETRGHVILVHDDDVTRTLVRMLDHFHYPYVMLAPTVREALALHDENIETLVGDLDDPDSYRRAGVDRAALLAATSTDVINTNVASTASALNPGLTILATAKDANSVDILELAGCRHVLRLGEMMGQALARRLVAGDAMSHIVGSFDQLHFAEATAANTPLVGKTLRESKLREHLSVTVVGLWQRGVFTPAGPDALIEDSSILVLAGTRQQLEEYDELFCIYNVTGARVIILGGGRVGRATGRALAQRKIDHVIVEELPDRIRDDEHYVLGSAADIEVLKKAGIMEAPAVFITTHDDDLNVYLAIYCRKLRPDIQVIARATLERNVDTLHRAGADFVLSYASMGANTLFNLLKRSDVLFIAEGLDLFKMKIPPKMAGRTLAELEVRKATGCTVVAYLIDGETHANPAPGEVLPPDSEIVVIGSSNAEAVFLDRYAGTRSAKKT